MPSIRLVYVRHMSKSTINGICLPYEDSGAGVQGLRDALQVKLRC